MAKRPADFSNRIKMSIAYRCGNRCSNPECRTCTLKEDANGNLYSYGVASHIEAASPGGKRYNPASSVEERSSIGNALWLCPTCSVIIDRDEDTYTVPLLREWKRKAESGIHTGSMTRQEDGQDGSCVRIFASANGSGGVGTSSVTAYLAQAFAAITGERVLCISVNAFDDAGKILFDRDEMGETPVHNVDYMGEEEFVHLYLKQQVRWGKLDLDEVVRDGNYQYVLIDCGGQFDNKELDLFHRATDLILPVGDHVHTARGMETVGRYLQKADHKVNVWPVFTKGLALSNKGYKLKWHQQIYEVLDRIDQMKNVTVKYHGIVIPKSSYVGTERLDIFEDKRTGHVAEAYMELAGRMLKEEKDLDAAMG